jgi:hypothetical protein
MPILKRFTYSLYILIATTMAVLLVLSIGEGIGLVRGVDLQGFMFHPLYLLAVYGVGFALAPVLHDRLPISGDAQQENQGSKRRFGYGVRVAALAAVGFILAVLGNLFIYLLGQFT